MLLEMVFRRVLWALMPLPAILNTLLRDMGWTPLLIRRAGRLISPWNLLLSRVKLAWKSTAFFA